MSKQVQGKGWKTSFLTIRLFTKWALLIVVLTGLGGYWLAGHFASERKKELMEALDNRLQIQAVAKGESVQLWLEGLFNRGSHLTDSDLMRLYASDLNQAGGNETEMDEELQAQKPYMEFALEEFTARRGVEAAALLSTGGKIHLGSKAGMTLTPKEKALAQKAYKQGRALVGDVREVDGELYMDTFVPVQSLTEAGQAPDITGIFMTTHPISAGIKKLLAGTPFEREGERVLLLYSKNGTLNVLQPDRLQKLGFQAKDFLKGVNDKGVTYQSPLDGQAMFFALHDVKNTPFMVLREYDAATALAQFAHEQRVVYLLATLIVVLVVVLMMGIVWYMLRTYNRQRSRLQEQTMNALVRALEIRDPYLAGHYQRVARLALKVAANLNMGVSARSTLFYAAKLSGIGKIFVPQDVLTKPGKLTKKEREQLQRHVLHAMNVLDGVELDLNVQPVIRQMYERLDGSGYPDGVNATEIHPLAKILGLCDAYCAMTSPRAYRDALEPEQAVINLEKEAEKYDDQALQALKAIIA